MIVTTDHVEAVVTRHAPHSPGGQLGLTASEDAAATCSLAAAAALSSPTQGEVDMRQQESGPRFIDLSINRRTFVQRQNVKLSINKIFPHH